MLRREAIALLAGAGCASAALLDRFFETSSGAALLLDASSRKLLGVHDTRLASQILHPPGSTIKPFALASLLDAGKMRAEESLPCPGRLTISGHSLNCSHPPVTEAIRPRTAIAYSCNYFVAQMASRFRAGELARQLAPYGFTSPTGWFDAGEAAGRLRDAAPPDASRLQALGEDGIAITLAELALAYRKLAARISEPRLQPILQGLEDAVEYGTAQRAAVPGLTVAGKTGSVRTSAGISLAWFAGFAPSRAPQVVVAVVLQGKSGGWDAAPVAGRILDAWHSGKL